MMKQFKIGDKVECSLSDSPGIWVIEKIEPFMGMDHKESRLTVRSTDPDYSKQNPIMITESGCVPVAD